MSTATVVTAEYMQDADVVIHEAQYTPQEYPSKRHWGHSTYVYVVELAVLAGVAVVSYPPRSIAR